MFCSKCGANLPDNANVCPQCGNAIGGQQQAASGSQTVPPPAPMTEDEVAVKRIKDNAKLCAILWIVVGACQCLSCVGIIAGVWNIIIGVRELKFIDTIVQGNRAVFETYDKSMTTIIIGAVINFVFGLLVGCALSVFEYFIRDQVIKNRKVFGA